MAVPPTRTTRAWQVPDRSTPEIVLAEHALPEPGPHEVVVQVQAVSLNHRDLVTIRDGRSVSAYPFVPASDACGVITAIGSQVQDRVVGERVITTFTPEWLDGSRPGTASQPAYRTLGGHHPGVLAEHLVLPSSWLSPAPTSLDALGSSTLPCAAVTAWAALVERGRLDSSQTVLIEGTGGVSLFGLQLAKAQGAEVIVSTSPDKIDRVLALGADHVIDRTAESVSDGVLRITEGRGADQVLEIVGGDHLARRPRPSPSTGTSTSSVP